MAQCIENEWLNVWSMAQCIENGSMLGAWLKAWSMAQCLVKIKEILKVIFLCVENSSGITVAEKMY